MRSSVPTLGEEEGRGGRGKGEGNYVRDTWYNGK
jgi:hypothetical protein